MIRLGLSAVLVAGVVALGGCTGSDADPSPTSPSPGASTGAGSTQLSQEAARVAEQYLPVRRPAAIASVRGTVKSGSGSMVAGTLDVLSVLAEPGSTAVRLRLATDQAGTSVSTNFYQVDGHQAADLSNVALLAPQANLRLLPGVWSGSEPASANCTCSLVPTSLGPDGVELSAVYLDLPTTVTQVQLKVPGFPAVTAPVTRG